MPYILEPFNSADEYFRGLADANKDGRIHGKTPLYSAVDRNPQHGGAPPGFPRSTSFEDFMFLLQDRADPNIGRSVDALTPLHVAAKNNNLKIMEMLLKARADVNQATKGYHVTPELPTEYAVRYDSIGALRVLLKARADPHSATFVAAHMNKVWAAQKLLLEESLDVNQPRSDGTTPIWKAARYNSPEVLQMLIKARANVDNARKDGRTALHAACRHSQVECVKLLLEARANMQTMDSSNRLTPLRDAEIQRNMEIVDLLRKAMKEQETTEAATLLTKTTPAKIKVHCPGNLYEEEEVDNRTFTFINS